MNWNGLVLINKPQGLTSHQVVQGIKHRLKADKAGHLGTLDPLATGVFPVCLGKATRFAPFYMGADKCYLTAIRFGWFTTTDDREGDPIGPQKKLDFSREQLEQALASFQGDYQQRPPAFSAKKIKGQKSYQLARKGKAPQLPLQKVLIHEIRLMHFDEGIATVYIHCASGTYVRSIAHDLGTKLKCGAHVHELTRTKFSEFSLQETCAPEGSLDALKASFIPMERMLAHLPEVILDSSQGAKILNGSSIEIKQDFQEPWVRVFSKDRHLLALAQVQPNRQIQPKIVFN
jgi:tRNA pseudouridine55 synthase